MGTFAEKVSYLNDTKLLIKDAIENKGVIVEEDTPFREYANKIASITASVDGIEPIVLTGSCQSMFKGGSISEAYIKLFGNTVSTSNITHTSYMFEDSQLTTIPFDINIDNKAARDMSNMFNRAAQLEELPAIINAYPSDIKNFTRECKRLRNIPEDYMDTWNFDSVSTYSYGNLSSLFDGCWSLRKVPVKIISNFHNDANTLASYKFFTRAFFSCYALDEALCLPIDNVEITSSMLDYTFTDCWRVKNITFETNEDGSAKIAKWKNQNLGLGGHIGYGNSYWNNTYIIGHNSGITADKEVKDDATYQALKNDPDWFTMKIEYSRYNHDSAVATINSLPDTSAYLTANGGTNIIRLKGVAGSATDGGAINTLTEEEIAVATAKGWTVTLV